MDANNLRAGKPTRETYDALQQAYDALNKALFEARLPNALITFQRRKGTFGYFAGGRFATDEGIVADEIALNPVRFRERSMTEILSTLAHEMVHLWQHHFGKPGRGRYHNREWAEMMKSVGLQPTDDGASGGKETGEAVGHLVVPGGPFETAATKLLARGFVIPWKEAAHPASGIGEGESGPVSKNGKRVRYQCPACKLRAWAKHDAALMCATDKVAMVAGT